MGAIASLILAALKVIAPGLAETVTKGLIQAHKDNLDSANETGRQLTDIALRTVDADIDARRAAKEVRLAMMGQPAMRWASGMVAITFALHITFIGIGTTFAAPLGWEWLAWTRRIPPFPKPIDEWEAVIMLGMFGVWKGGDIVAGITTIIARKGR